MVRLGGAQYANGHAGIEQEPSGLERHKGRHAGWIELSNGTDNNVRLESNSSQLGNPLAL